MDPRLEYYNYLNPNVYNPFKSLNILIKDDRFKWIGFKADYKCKSKHYRWIQSLKQRPN